MFTFWTSVDTVIQIVPPAVLETGYARWTFDGQHRRAACCGSGARASDEVLVASATTVRNDTVLGLQRDIEALKDTAPVPETFARDFQVSTIFHPLPAEFLQAVVKESLKVPVHVWRETMAEMLSPEAQVELKKIKTPTLILWGDKETIFPRSEQDRLVSELRHSTLKVYADTGHALHWERPERFAKDLQEFIN